MAQPEQHWTETARDVASRLEGLDRSSRADRIEEEAAARDLKVNTVRRYVVGLSFLNRIGVSEPDQASIPLGPLEVVVRLWSRDQAVAARALREIQAGRMTYRDMLKLERQVRGQLAVTPAPSNLPPELTETLRIRIMQALADEKVTDLEEVNQMEDPRFELAQVQKVYRDHAGSTVAYLDEACFYDAPTNRGFLLLMRQILTASVLYDHVVVDIQHASTMKFYEAYIRLARLEARMNIGVLPGELKAFEFGR